MFQATIHDGADRPLRVSGTVTPYDLQVLREHILARVRRGTRVEVRMPAAERPRLAHLLDELARRGVDLVVEP